jgi:hypothetical protein
VLRKVIADFISEARRPSNGTSSVCELQVSNDAVRTRRRGRKNTPSSTNGREGWGQEGFGLKKAGRIKRRGDDRSGRYRCFVQPSGIPASSLQPPAVIPTDATPIARALPT